MGKKSVFLLLFVCFSLSGITQVCNGSLGDPVVNITFGAGDNPGSTLRPGTTSYTYTSKDCPGDGEYAIRNFTLQCYSDTWVAVPFDHTPQDGNNGYYMEINGGDKKDYYVGELTGLCPNSTYELSFWVLNLSKPGAACEGNASSPDIRYDVETLSGAVLSSAKTGNVPQRKEAVWNQYTLLFSTTSAPLAVRLSNNGMTGCGMDFLLDDITVRPCGPVILATAGQNGLSSLKACAGDAARIDLKGSVGTGFALPVFQWQVSQNSGITWTDILGETSLLYSRQPTNEGEYYYRLLVGESSNILSQCRTGSNPVHITIEKAPFAQGTNYSYCIGKDITLFAAGGEKYFWTGPNGFSSNLQSPVIPNISFSDSGLYKVQVTTSAGCKASDSTHLFIYSNPVAVVSPDVSICEGSSTTLLAGGGSQYSWTPAASLSSRTAINPVATPAVSTTYTVLVTLNGCFDTATVRVLLWKKPVADAGPDKKVKKGQAVSLSGFAKGTDISYFWTPDMNINNTRILNPLVTVPEDFTYTLHVVSDKGCGTSKDEVRVKVYDRIFIPNAFSPNGDGINDVWNIDPLDLFGDTQTQVFNRYGQVVFSCRGYTKPWDGSRNGQPLPAGTYYYMIDLRNGSPVMAGSVTIIR